MTIFITKKPQTQAEKPLVSIITPSFNQGQFIEETINSILSQTYRPLELIVIDGGSTDNTVDILRKYDDQITWISEPDEGQADAVNKGFKLARGEIIGWLNSDDVYFTKTAVESMAQAFQTYPEADIIYGEVAIISRTSILIRFWLVPPYEPYGMRYGSLISQPATFFRRHVTETEKLDQRFINLDREYWLRLTKKGYSFQHIQKLIAGDRNYGERISISLRSKITAKHKRLQEMYDVAGLRSKYLFPGYYIWRFRQIFCRLRGFAMVIGILFDKHYHNKLAFPMKIDSVWNILLRQLFRGRASIID
jgi:glycosyltransferase involved in cell wall biosynthesis